MNLLSNIFGFLLFLGFWFGEIAGIIHSVHKHSTGDVIASVIIPPWAWYRSAELFWHDDFDGVNWDKKLNHDLITCYYFVDQVEAEKNTYKLNEEIEEFSDKINKYPSAKRAVLVDGTRKIIYYSISSNEDFLTTLDNYERTGNFTLVSSPHTIRLEQELIEKGLGEDIRESEKATKVAMERLGKGAPSDTLLINHSAVDNLRLIAGITIIKKKTAFKRFFKLLFGEDL